MKIAITIRDNDFWSTYTSVLKIINQAYKWRLDSNEELDVTDRESLITMIDELSYGCYLSFQHGKPSESTRKYLKLRDNTSKLQQLYINEEVDEMIKNGGPNGWFNGDVFILDTDLDYPNNECVYIM
jgi:hypothetical protein